LGNGVWWVCFLVWWVCFPAICFLYHRASRRAANMRRSIDRSQFELKLLASEGR